MWQLRDCELISELEVRTLCEKAKEVLQKEKNIHHVSAPVTVGLFLCWINARSAVIFMANFTICASSFS